MFSISSLTYHSDSSRHDGPKHVHHHRERATTPKADADKVPRVDTLAATLTLMLDAFCFRVTMVWHVCGQCVSMFGLLSRLVRRRGDAFAG